MSEELQPLLQDRQEASGRAQKRGITKQIWKLKRRIKRERHVQWEDSLLKTVGPSGQPCSQFIKASRPKKRGPLQISEQSQVPGRDLLLPPAEGSKDIGDLFTAYFKSLYLDGNLRPARGTISCSDEEAKMNAYLIFTVETVKANILEMKS